MNRNGRAVSESYLDGRVKSSFAPQFETFDLLEAMSEAMSEGSHSSLPA